MSASTVSKPPPLRSDEQPLAGYRSVSPLAVLAVCLGLASALILTTPLLALVPVAGIVVAAVALRAIGSSGGQLAGRVPAICGLCLATFFLGLGMSQHLVRQTVLEQRAREMSDVFLNLLEEGKAKEAHQFRQVASARITSPEAIAEHYEKNAEAAKELHGFISSPGVKDLIVRGHQADVRFDTVASAVRDGQNDMLMLKYTYLPSGSGSTRQGLWVHINRKFDEGTKRPQWDISGVTTEPPPGREQ
jgi:hypothetical protein